MIVRGDMYGDPISLNPHTFQCQVQGELHTSKVGNYAGHIEQEPNLP